MTEQRRLTKQTTAKYYIKKHLSDWFIKTSLTAILAAITTIGFGQVTLPKVFSDHMVLQRNTDIPVWGNAAPKTEISIQFAERRTSTITDAEGKWMVKLPRMQAGGPYKLEVFEGKKPFPVVQFEDILIGDVWVASGQSNMEWQVQQAMNAETEIKNAHFPSIRLFNVAHDKQLTPQEDIAGGTWAVCDTSSVKEASAVAYFFARQLNTEMNVPIGILQSTWGGTPVEAWTSREMSLSSPITREHILMNDSLTTDHFVKDSLDLIRFWDIVYNPKNKTDKTIPKKNLDDSDWDELNMPSTFKDWNIPPYEGMVWFRKTVALPDNMRGKELTINLGHPEMNYSLYFNGTEICKTVWNANKTHHYSLPAKLTKSGKCVIAVRMAVLWGGGGFNPPAENMYITDGENKISLTGAWKYKKDLEPTIPKIYNYHQYPNVLYNGMINPIIPYGIKGFIWYQGENNAEAGYDYRTLFPMMINDWRVRWQQGYLPFLYVQLANYMKTSPEPSESDWAALREAQTMTLTQPNTGMACIIDLGEADNIHPTNKQEVGRRLALLAEKLVYNKNVQASGPLYKGYTVEGNQIRVHFTETGSGLSTRDGLPLKGFAIAGSDHKFYWANAVIDGNDVVVSTDKVTNPVAVRYAWADNPECNLINQEGLPAIPFRSDSNRKDKEQ
ncbi:sialate O-acetylesterase [Limibacter armeniacum]|uniref:sialate O-acetylesterase n=1 Tax=Limibacter armeniacum TaxID=466084 RepID=UPI002FE5C886